MFLRIVHDLHSPSQTKKINWKLLNWSNSLCQFQKTKWKFLLLNLIGSKLVGKLSYVIKPKSSFFYCHHNFSSANSISIAFPHQQTKQLVWLESLCALLPPITAACIAHFRHRRSSTDHFLVLRRTTWTSPVPLSLSASNYRSAKPSSARLRSTTFSACVLTFLPSRSIGAMRRRTACQSVENSSQEEIFCRSTEKPFPECLVIIGSV